MVKGENSNIWLVILAAIALIIVFNKVVNGDEFVSMKETLYDKNGNEINQKPLFALINEKEAEFISFNLFVKNKGNVSFENLSIISSNQSLGNSFNNNQEFFISQLNPSETKSFSTVSGCLNNSDCDLKEECIQNKCLIPLIQYIPLIQPVNFSLVIEGFYRDSFGNRTNITSGFISTYHYISNQTNQTINQTNQTIPPQVNQTISDNYLVNSNIILESKLYSIADSQNNGILIINSDNIVLDCNGATFNGGGFVGGNWHSNNFKGYAIYNNGHSNIEIKNCNIHGYYYAIYSKNGNNIKITNSNLSGNFVDLDQPSWSSKTIGVMTNPQINSYGVNRGGGIYLENSQNSLIDNVTGNNQNIGVDFYNVDNSEVKNSDVSNVMTWGIHLRDSDSNTINNNQAHHIARNGLGVLNIQGNNKCNFNLDPNNVYLLSDNNYPCGGDTSGMMIINSNFNTITNNNFQWNDVGLFLSGNDASGTLRSNDNIINNNDGSHALANSFEVTFGDRNTLTNNIGSYSRYGIWAGYGRYYLINGNQLNHNYNAGIEIENGEANQIIGNTIDGSFGGTIPVANYCTFNGKCYRALFLRYQWSQDLENDYPGRFNKNNIIRNNIFKNTYGGVLLDDVSDSIIENNNFINNDIGLEFVNLVAGEPAYQSREAGTINNIVQNNNIMDNNLWNFWNHQPQSVVLENNYWGSTNIATINSKITKDGGVDIEPFSGQTSPVGLCPPILENGDPSTKINLVVVGDAFTDINSLKDYYAPICAGTINPPSPQAPGILKYSPFMENLNKFNVYYLNELNNYNFEFTCNYLSNIKNDVLSKCPFADKIIVIVNNDYTGGFSCGQASDSFVVGKIRVNGGGGVCAHEFGHSFGNLCDEYNQGTVSGGKIPTCPNCDSSSTCSKWSSITTGCYNVCGYTNWFKPAQYSVMGDWRVNTAESHGPVSTPYLQNIINQLTI